MKTPKVTLEQWRTLQAVVEYGSFSKAGEKLYRSQSAISYTIKHLQEQLGVPLLEIQGRQAVLNNIGEHLLRRADALINDALNLEALATALKQGREAELQLVIETIFPTSILMDVLKTFSKQDHPTRIQLRETVLSGTDEALQEGTADIVIGPRPPKGMLGNVLMEIEFIAVAHPDHPLHQLKRTLTSADLVNEMQVVIRDSGTRKRDAGWLGAEQRWTVSSIDKAIITLANGMGFAWVVKHHIKDHLKNGLLKPLPLETGQTRKTHLYLMHGKQNVGPSAKELAQLFYDATKDYR